MYHSNETWVMMALRELLCYCHIVGPRHLHPLVRWGDHCGCVPIGPCWKACTRFRVRDSQGPHVCLGLRDWGVELLYKTSRFPCNALGV